MRFVPTKFNEFGLLSQTNLGTPTICLLARGMWQAASGKWHTLWTQKIDFCKQQQLSVAVGTYVEGPQRQKIVRLLASEGDAIKDVYICTYI